MKISAIVLLLYVRITCASPTTSDGILIARETGDPVPQNHPRICFLGLVLISVFTGWARWEAGAKMKINVQEVYWRVLLTSTTRERKSRIGQ